MSMPKPSPSYRTKENSYNYENNKGCYKNRLLLVHTASSFLPRKGYIQATHSPLNEYCPARIRDQVCHYPTVRIPSDEPPKGFFVLPYPSQNTKQPQLCFHALLSDGTREVRFEQALG